MLKAAVLGAGSWGTALANVLSSNGHDVIVWGRDRRVVDSLNYRHENDRYLPGAELSTTLRATDDVNEALTDANFVIVSVPSKAIPDVCTLVAPYISSEACVVHAVKGFIRPDNTRVAEYMAKALPKIAGRLVVLSGPSHAEEVVRRKPTTVVVASESRSAAEMAQDVLMNEHLRVYTQSDMVGVELGGTLKNIIALGVGLTDGLDLGDNTKAALMTRGLAEMTRLGVQLGASPLTFSGLAGVGDLIVTCTSSHSRNYRAGKLLASGLTLSQTLSQIGMAVEGVGTTFAAAELASSHHVEMPITRALRRVLEGLVAPENAVRELMQRDKNHEMEDVGQQPLTHDWRRP
ncbi:NAD(P)H-dependent glycerol-3-phosphate dehydrogenase [Alicyclobacillus dauci]|uniref:Glycerol-3-phosphate dehydrogenase [NAD(P)+] n=1 Tax=Alicyclobacillus dauci TaxID=1475485 RepID=A0ABY6Z9H7_9BACL|nr:NAD(P)H-dependent glycerol-3-phosphate dehydrogenase [Alicyclobacillus dauci]WAH39202.1 NAD(P)H-dependent glycerol-3-phosphate dehydrogenase [Alicyclobacillus dauci]